jgi:hypothetical protein
VTTSKGASSVPALGFTDQRQRLRRIVENALDGATYEASHSEADGRLLVIEARRAGGQRIVLRFRGVRRSDADAMPAAGTTLRLQGVSADRVSCIGVVIPIIGPILSRSSGASRVRIEAGATRLDIVCEDAEWWEDEGRRTP